MSLEKILSITGKPGLYQLKTQTRGGFLAESLVDGKKISVGARHNVSLLSEIAVYTLTEEVPLREVFAKISEKENGGEAINHKEPKIKLEEYFFEILPDYDEDRVYASDIKKIFQWYNLLVKNNVDMMKVEEKSTDKSENETVDSAEDKDETTATKAKKVSPKAAPKGSVTPKGGSPKASSGKKGGGSKNTAARKK